MFQKHQLPFIYWEPRCGCYSAPEISEQCIFAVSLADYCGFDVAFTRF